MATSNGSRPTRQAKKAEIRARKEAEARAAARKASIRRATVLAVAGLVGYAAIVWIGRPEPASALSATARAAGEAAGCENLGLAPQVADPSRDHVPTGQAVDYDVQPPAPGTHAADPLPTDPRVLDAPPDETQVVHTLEHGSVMISYLPPGDPGGVSQATIDALAPVAEGSPATYLAPSAALPEGTGFALRAWNVAVTCPGSISTDDAVALTEGFAAALACTSNAPEARAGDGC